MLRHGLILTSHREYAQAMRLALLGRGDEQTRVDVELDALRAMQLVPHQYELILLDAMLDSMDGLQLLVLMKQQAPASKFVIVSQMADEAARAHAYQNGADFFLERPVTPEDFQKALNGLEGLLKAAQSDQPPQKEADEPLVRISDRVQTHCLSGDSVLLMVRRNQQSGDIFIYRGEVFHAQYPGKSGEGAFLDMIHWDDGLVRIKALPLNHPPPRTIETPYRQLLEKANQTGALAPDMRLRTGELRIISGEKSAGVPVPDVMREAPPLRDMPATPAAESARPSPPPTGDETTLPPVNAHWKINLMGELVEGSQVAAPDRCSFITYFIYRKMADVAVALEVDYFNHMTLFGTHLQQVLVADNMGVRHAVFDTPWTSEDQRIQFVKWCCEQSF